MRRLLLKLVFCLVVACMGAGLSGVSADTTTPPCTASTNPLTCACSTPGGSTASVCSKTGTNDPITGTHGVIRKVSLIIATIAGIAAVIIIIVAGLEMVVSSGDPQQAANARSAIIGAAVGLVIIAASESILIFVLSKV